MGIGLALTPRRGEVVDAPAALAEVRAFDLAMYDATGQAAVGARAAGFFTGLDCHTPVRILALARPFSAEPALRHIQDLRRACPPHEDWRQSGLAAFATFLETLVEQADLRSTQYFLLAWPAAHLPPTALFRAAQDSFLTPVVPLPDLPPFFDDCREEWDHLAPRERGLPYLGVYGSYDFVGTWSLETIRRILRLPFPLALSLDLETLGPDKAQFQLQNAYNALYAQLSQQSKFGGKDTRSEEAFGDVKRAMAAVEAGERIHKLTLAILLKAPSVRKLATDSAYLLSTLAPYVRLRPLRGQQAQALKLFTATPRAQIPIDLRPRPVTSIGCGIAMPFGLPSRIETQGILWGIDLATGNPVFHDGWAAAHGEGGRPFHATFFGFTGYGKTFAMQTLLYRLVLTGTQVIVIEPMGHFARLARALGAGASYNRVAFERSALNLLDIVQPTLTDQISHVKRQLALLLSCEPGAGAPGAKKGRRVFSNDEAAGVEQALEALYRPIWGEALVPALTPRLQDLCDRLDNLEGSASHKIAGEVRRTYVTGLKAGSFNRATNLDLRFDRPCTVFDVSGIDQDFRPLYYMQLTTVLNGYIRNPARTRPLVIAIDEFRYMAQDPVLAHAATTLIKTARTFHTAVWTADQNPGTYMQNEDGRQMVALSPLVFIGRQQAEDLELHRHLFQRLTTQHMQQIATARCGQFVTMMGDDYYFLQIEPSPVELVAFRGT
jgi:hypothetical protein